MNKLRSWEQLTGGKAELTSQRYCTTLTLYLGSLVGDKAKTGQETGQETGHVVDNVADNLTERQRIILDVLRNAAVNVAVNVTVNTKYLSEKLKVNMKTIQRDLAILQEQKLVQWIGSDKTGHWEIIE